MSDLEAPEGESRRRSSAPRSERLPFGTALSDLTLSRSTRTQRAIPMRARIVGACRLLMRAVERMLQEEAERGRATLFAPVYMGAGAIVWFELATDPPIAAIATGAVIFAACFLLKQRSRPSLRHGFLAATLLLTGMLLAQFQTWRASTIMLDSSVTTNVTAQVQQREVDDRGRWRYDMAVLATDTPAVSRPPDDVALTVRGQDVPFELGDIVQGKARIGPPAGPALPGLNDFAFRAYFDGIGANGYFYGKPMRLSSAAEEMGDLSVMDRFTLWLTALRSRIGDRIRMLLPGDTGAFAASLVNDERRAISQETTDALRVSGLAHIIAISGLNMALSAGIFYVGLRHALSLFPALAQAWPTKKIAAVGALLTVTAYYLISGFGVSAERAFVMMAIMLVAVLFDRPSISLRNVALSAIAILILSPSEILGPSFQMSYAATVALVSGYSIWKRRPRREQRFAALRLPPPLRMISRFFTGIATTSFIGGASTAIFSIEHFHRLATYGLVANLAAMPVVSFIVMPVGMIAMLLMPLGLDGIFWSITGFGLDIVIVIAKTVAAWGGNVPFARLPAWLFPTIIAGFLLMTLLRTQLRHLGVLVIASAVAIAALAPRPPLSELLIAEDGDLVALARNGQLEPNRERPSDFIFQQWQRALSISAMSPPQMLPPDDSTPPHRARGSPRVVLDDGKQKVLQQAMETALDTVQDGRFACHSKDWCGGIARQWPGPHHHFRPNLSRRRLRHRRYRRHSRQTAPGPLPIRAPPSIPPPLSEEPVPSKST